MTCIVGFIANDGRIIMGADCAGVNSNGDLEHRDDPKVFRNGRYIIGVSGSWTAVQRLRFNPMPSVSLAAKPIEVHAFMVTDILPWLARTMPVHEEFEFLLGFEGELYHFHSSRQVGVAQESFDACGSGAQVARGALWALTDGGGMPETLVGVALQAAERFCSGVVGPFQIEVIE